MGDGNSNQWRVTRALLLFFGLGVGGASCSYVLELLHAPSSFNVIVDAQLYFLLFIPLAYLADKRVFSSELWTARRAMWVPVATMVVIQICIESVEPLPRTDVYRMFAAIALAPFVEELVRAVMMLAFTERFGVVSSIALTAFLTATAHAYFWTALFQQTLLSIIFWKSRRSLPAVMAAHLAMNLIAAWHVRFQSFR